MAKHKVNLVSQKLKSFSFVNKAGGTALSNWEYNKKYEGVAEVKVIECFEDWETGWRYIAEAINEPLIQYLKENANADDQRVFFSEFETA